MSSKIGIGVVTCERPDYFTKCINSVPDGVGTVVVVNDGAPYDPGLYPAKVSEVIQHERNLCVGISKNEALRYLMAQGCEYLFLIEDDMELLRHDVFERYIRTAEISGVWHLNYGPGSPFNRRQATKSFDLHTRHLLDKTSPPAPRLVVDYEGGYQIALYEHTVAMFSFFSREVIERAGFHDETYTNAWEHVDLTYRIIKAGMHPPFWYFADVWDSTCYIREQEGAIENSAIAKDERKWEMNLQLGAEHYRQVHGHYPNEVRNATEDEVRRILHSLRLRYALRRS